MYLFYYSDEDPDDENNVVRQGSDKKPSGKVVGIIKRSWKPYLFHVILGIQ